MQQKTRWRTFACLLILFAAVGSGGFFFGKNMEKKRFQEEKNFNILLNRSDLEGLGKIKGTIYVTGQKARILIP